MAKPDDKIGPYTLIRKLGRGAFGVVWLAEKRGLLLTTKVALKLPNDDDIDLDAVRSEATVWEHAGSHPNVLPIIDADIYDSQVVIVSEYAPDGSLAAWLARHGGKATSVEAALRMTDGILAGLEHLHSKNIIHRDLKPDNILLQGETPRLADFGIARLLKTANSYTTTVSGTPKYMAPETYRGKRSKQTDIWAVGVILYQLLTGSFPFPQEDSPSLMYTVLTEEPVPLPASIPYQLRQIIIKALEKDPERRYHSAKELREAIQHFMQSQAATGNSQDKADETTQKIPLVNADTLSEEETLVRKPETPEPALSHSWHNFVFGEAYRTSAVVEVCKRHIFSGKVENPEEKLEKVRQIENCGHTLIVYAPRGEGWGNSPMNPNNWETPDGRPILERRELSNKHKGGVQVNEPVVAITINQQFPYVRTDEDLYNATRSMWRVSLSRANRAKYAFAVYQNVIKEVYEINRWIPVTKETLKYWEDRERAQGKYFPPEVHEGRSEFIGKLAPEEIRRKYVGQRMPVASTQNPIRYINC